MNTPERNKKNIAQMQKLGQIYSEPDEKSKEEALENATKEYPLPTARKAAWVLCGGFWLFSLIGMLFGMDVFALMPFTFFALAVLAILYIPVFYVKKKTGDVIMGTIFALACIGMGISLLLG